MKIASVYCLLLTLALTGACTRSADRIAAEAVKIFHVRMNAGEYQQIYNEADERLRGSITERDLTNKLQAARNQMGKIHNAHIPGNDTLWQSWQAGFSSAKEERKIHSPTTCDAGVGLEHFVWSVKQGRARLLDYEYAGIVQSINTK